MVYDITRLAQGADRRMQGLRRVRFKQIVLPHDRLDVTISFVGRNRGKSVFQVLSAGELVSSGHMFFESRPDELVNS